MSDTARARGARSPSPLGGTASPPWFSQPAAEAGSRPAVDSAVGLDTDEAPRRLVARAGEAGAARLRQMPGGSLTDEC